MKEMALKQLRLKMIFNKQFAYVPKLPILTALMCIFVDIVNLLRIFSYQKPAQ